jgi:hypothetical protein
VFSVDAANAKQGLAPYANGCATADLKWFDLSSNRWNGTLRSFSSCGTSVGWNGSGTVASPYELTLDGNGYAEFPHSSSLAITGDITLETWVNPTLNASSSIIMGKTLANIPAPFDWYLNTNSGSNGISVFLRGNGTVCHISNSNGTIQSGTWSHLVVTMSGTTVTHYKNASANGSGTLTTTIGDAGRTLRVGTRDDLINKFKGSMAISRIYNRALTSQEIKQNCLAQERRFTNTPQSICGAP